MGVSRRFVLFGTAAAAALATTRPGRLRAATIDIAGDGETKARLMRMVKVAFPHANFPDSCYDRNCDAILKAASGNPGQIAMFYQGIADLKAAGFDSMDDAEALAHLQSIEDTEFFQLMRGTTILTLYNDHEVWQILGYEGASFDKGGYINRGFNDLDWLPEPRITEL
ncbi:MAG: hypothetical protein AAGG56_12125 [Pseudomonadota bacterium]